jgi:type III secretion protein HrpB1
MESNDIQTTDPKALASALTQALKNNRVGEAERLYDALQAHLTQDDLLTFRVLILIQRGRVLDALREINELPEDRCPELKVICLKILKDPTWASLAESLEASPKPGVRKAMRQVQGKPAELEPA